MNFLKAFPIVAATTTADPRSAPQSVPEAQVFVIKALAGPNTDAPALSLVVALEGTAANTAAVELYALDETAPANTAFADLFKPASTDKWYKLVAATTVTVGGIAIVSPLTSGKLYLRVSTASAADSTLKVGLLPRT